MCDGFISYSHAADGLGGPSKRVTGRTFCHLPCE